MYGPLTLAFKYLRYYLTAANGKGHGVHSPFVFEFITRVLNDKRRFYAFDGIEKIRTQLLSNHSTIEIQDFGAGSRVAKTNTRKVSDVAKGSLKPAKYSQLLFRMIDYYGPAQIMELGTSLGITTAYLASANTNAKVTTFEGSATIAQIARQNHGSLGLANISLLEGNFDDQLPKWLAHNKKVDFAFIDGNHAYKPTIAYFEALLDVVEDHSILVFDDIHWSREMEAAWAQISAHPRVTLSIDLFFIGIVFFRKEFAQKQQVSIRF
ncbi:MAG: class I SAM-dependent methyltransferase [Bacteroidetes bacterium]|nr:class I SAM-dependent methyltransferase [Bacteroidota bacterium]